MHLRPCFRMCRYEQEGTRRSVDAVMLVAERNIPHVLLIQACKPHASNSSMSSEAQESKPPALGATCYETVP